MNWRHTAWIVATTLALALFIALVERPARLARTQTTKAALLLPLFNPASVTTLEVRDASGASVSVLRTNDLWKLASPERHPAQQHLAEGILRRVAALRGPSVLTAAELRSRPQAAPEFGLTPPALAVRLAGRTPPVEILLGSRSIDGAKVYCQVSGISGIFATDASLADLLSTDPDTWRERTLVPLDRLVFDRLRVDVQGAAFTLARSPPEGRWEVVEPRPARADPARVSLLLHQLGSLQILQFVDPATAPPLEIAGLRPPRLAVTLAQGTNEVFGVALGAPTTNAPSVFARRLDSGDLFTVPAAALDLLRLSYKDLLDRRILRVDPEAIREIAFSGGESFQLVRKTNDWRLLPQNAPADPDLVQHLIRGLVALEILDTAKDVVTDLDLSSYGLAPPDRQITLLTAAGNTNAVAAQLETGALQENRVFARVLGEQPVYLLSPADVQAIPIHAWQLRDRVPWRFDSGEVTSIVVSQDGLETPVRRLGNTDWALPPGLRNEINPFALDEALHRFGNARALSWVAAGDSRSQALGIGRGPELLIELRGNASTNRLHVAFGKRTPAGHRYASATLPDGDRLTFELPGAVCDELWRELGLTDPPVVPGP